MKDNLKTRGQAPLSLDNRQSGRRSRLLAWIKAMLLMLIVLTGNVGTSLQAVAGGANAYKAAEPDFAAIDAYVEGQMKETSIQGLALAIVQGDRIVHIKGFGI